MFQIKFMKPLTLSRNGSLPTKYVAKPTAPLYDLTATLTVSNDLGEQFFYGNTTVTVEARYYSRYTPESAHEGVIIGATEENWGPGKRAIDVKIQASRKSAPSGGYVAMFAYVGTRTVSKDMMNYDDVTVQDVIQEQFDGLDTSLFDSCKVTEMNRVKGLHFLPTLSDLLKVPENMEDLPVKTERMAIRVIEKGMKLYEELSGEIARHIWDTGVLINKIPNEKMYEFLSLEGKQVGANDKLNILELGTGIGILGIQMSKMFTKSNVLVTDLDDAKEICERNIKLNAVQDRVKFDELDWEDENKTPTVWDIICVVDCQYNPVYYDALIKVLKRECGPKTVVYLAHKFRESYSESEFFTKIGKPFTIQKQQWHSDGHILVHIGLYTPK